MSTKVWNLCYRAGNSNRVITAADSPQSKASAIEGAQRMRAAGNPWQSWIEHHKTGEVIFGKRFVPGDASTAVQPVADLQGASQESRFDDCAPVRDFRAWVSEAKPSAEQLLAAAEKLIAGLDAKVLTAAAKERSLIADQWEGFACEVHGHGLADVGASILAKHLVDYKTTENDRDRG